MKIRKMKKIVVLVLSICMVFQNGNSNVFGNKVTEITNSIWSVENSVEDDYIVAEAGRLEFTGEGISFYVDAVTGNDSNDGSVDHPFGTIRKAITEIEGSLGIGSIYLQSDISLSEPEIISGSITLSSDSNALLIDNKDYYKITQSDDFEVKNYIDSMFFITGSLTLGDINCIGDDDNPSLVYDGRGIQEDGSVIYNMGLVTIYPGVSIINRIQVGEGYGIINNKGNLYMLGGTIHNNVVDYAAVWNDGNFTMADGKISNNTFTGDIIYNNGSLYIKEEAVISDNNSHSRVIYNNNKFNMEGGIIEGNNVYGTVFNRGTVLFTGGSICNNTNTGPPGCVFNLGELILDGGYIYGNTGKLAGAVYNVRNFLMKSGSIYNNNGINTGGVFNEGTFNMSGGLITGNTNGGISHYSSGELIMSGEAIVTSDNVINLQLNDSGNSGVFIIEGTLTGTYPSSDPIGASIIKRSSNTYPLGKKVLSSDENYIFTEDDLDYFKLADDTYAINREGNIGRSILNADVETSFSTMYYDGIEKHLDSVSVTLESGALTEGTEYEVEYKNNIHSGDRAAAIIRGIGEYAGRHIRYFTILPSTAESIITAEPVGFTRRASDGLGEQQLAEWIPCTDISVKIGGSGNICHSSVSWVWDTADDSCDVYNVKGGVYRFKAQFLNPSLDFGSLTFGTTVTVVPSVLVSPTFSDAVVRIGTDEAATASELGAGVLPTSGTYIWTDGDNHTSLDYTIVWDYGQTLNRTDPRDKTTFTGTLTYDPGDIPEWATLPGDFRVRRTVSVINPIETSPEPSPTHETISDFIVLGEGMGNMQVMITGPDSSGSLQADFILPEEDLLDLIIDNTSGKPIPLSIPITSEKLLNMIKEAEGGKVDLNLVIPDSILSGDFDISEIILDPEILKAIKETGKDITILIKDAGGNILYSWRFFGEDLDELGDDENIDYVNLALSIRSVMDDKLGELLNTGTISTGLVLEFNHVGMLPAQSTVRIYVGDQEGVKPGDRIYLYYHDPATGLLATLPYSSGIAVDKDGYINLHIIHCSEYIILPKAADPKLIISLRNQISVSPLKETLYTGSSNKSEAKISINLPDTLQLVENLGDITSGKAVGAVTISYRSDNKKVATVDKDGIIQAVGSGTTIIYVELTLYSGKTKTVKIKVTVKKGK